MNNPLLEKLNSVNYFGRTVGEEEYNSLFGNPEGQEKLRSSLNSSNFFGRTVESEEFNSKFFSSPSSGEEEAITEEAPEQAQFGVDIPERETRGFSTDLPEVQTEGVVPDFDPTAEPMDATSIGNLTADSAQEMDSSYEFESLQWARNNKDKILSGEISEREVRQKLFNDAAAQKGLNPNDLSSGQIGGIAFGFSRPMYDKIMEDISPKEETLEEQKAEMAKTQAEVNQLPVMTAQSRLDEVNAKINDPLASESDKALFRGEKEALEAELKEAKQGFRDEYNIDSFIEGYTDKSVEDKSTRGIVTTTNMEEGFMFQGQIYDNSPQKVAFLNEVEGAVDKFLSVEDDLQDVGAEELGKIFNANPYLKDEHIKQLQGVMFSARNGGLNKEQMKAMSSEIYFQSLRDEFEPKSSLGRFAIGVASIPTDIAIDILELGAELPASVAMTFASDSDEVKEAKQKVADAFEQNAVGNMSVEEVNAVISEFRDVESKKVNEYLFTDDSFFEIDMAENIATKEAERQFKKDSRRLTDNTWEGLEERYEKGEISKMEEVWLKGGVAMSNAFQSSPSFVQAMIPYIGIATMSASAGMDKYYEGVAQLDTDYKDLFVGSVAVALAEGLSGKIEKTIGTDAIRNMTKAARASAIRHTVKDYKTYLEALQKGISKPAKIGKALQKGGGKFLFDANAEGVGEMFVTMTTNVVDKNILGKDVGIMDGVEETYWTGFAMGGTVGVVSGGAEAAYTYKSPFQITGELARAHRMALKMDKNRGRAERRAEGEVAARGSEQDFTAKMLQVAGSAGVSLEVARDAVKMTLAEGSNKLDVADRAYEAALMKDMARRMVANPDQAAEIAAEINEKHNGERAIVPDEDLDVVTSPEQKRLDDMRVTRDEDVVIPEGAEDINKVDEKKYHMSEVSTTQDIGKFVKAFNEAREKRPDTKLQVAPVTEAQLQKIIEEGGRVYMTSDGMAGGYVTKDGYMGGLFRDPEAMKGRASKVIMDEMVKVGGRFFDAFGVHPDTKKGTTLEEIYIKNGFRPIARMTFNPEMAPEGWQESSTLVHQPDNVWFVYDPTYEAEIGEGERIEDYDQAYETAQQFIQSNPTPSPEAEVPAGMEGITPVQGETLDRFSERANEASREGRETQEDVMQERRDRMETDGVPEGWNGTAAELEAEYQEIINDSTRAINQDSTPEEVALFIRQMFQNFAGEGVDMRSKSVKDAIRVVTESVVQAQEFARGNGSLFIMPLNAEDASVINAFTLGGKIGEMPVAHGFYVAATGDIHIDPFTFLNSSEFANLSPERRFANIANATRHELFHGIIDVALRAANLRGFGETKVKLEIARQIASMFDKGRLKFAGAKAEAEFKEFLSRYKGDPTPAIIEEMFTELVPRILTGEVLFDSRVKMKGWNKLVNLIIDMVNDILGTSIDFNKISLAELDSTLEAEAMITSLLAATKPSEVMSIKQINAVMGQIFLRAEQRAYAFNERLGAADGDQDVADANKRNRFFKQFVEDPDMFMLNAEMFTEQELDTMNEVGDNPIGQIMFARTKPSVKGKDYIAFRNDIANTRLINTLKKEAKENGYEVFVADAGVVVTGMSEQVALNFMRDNNEVMNGVIHNGSILLSDGTRVPTPKQLGHKTSDMHLGRAYLNKDGALKREHALDPTIQNNGEASDAVEILYDEKTATSIIESVSTKGTEKTRLQDIAKAMREAGLLNAAKTLEMVTESMSKLPLDSKIKLNLTKTNLVNKDSKTLVVDLAIDNAGTIAYKMVQHVIANQSGDMRAAYIKKFTPTKLMDSERFPTTKNTALNLLSGILTGRYSPTEAEVMDIANKIIEVKNEFIAKTLKIPAMIPSDVVNSKEAAIEVITASVNELMYMDSDVMQDVLQEEGSFSGSLHTDRYVMYEDLETERPREMTQEKLNTWARQYEKQLGLPEGSVVVPMFDPRRLPKGTRVMQVPHDRQYSGVVRSPYGGDFEASGGVLGMFHPKRFEDGTVYMSELSAVASFVNAAERTARFIAKEQGLSEVPNKVIVAPAMGKDNWLNNEDTSKFVSFMAEEYYGEDYTNPITKRFKDYVEGLFTAFKTDYVKEQARDSKTGELKFDDDGKEVMTNKLGADGKKIVEREYLKAAAPLKVIKPILDKSETIKDFFDGVSTLAFKNRASISAKYLSAEVAEKKILNRKKSLAQKKSVYDVKEGHKDAVFFSQMKDALLNVMIEPTWNNMPTNHLVAMFEVDIAATKAEVEKNLQLQRNGQPLTQSVPHNTYDTDIKGEWLGVLTESMYAPKTLDFSLELLEETMLRAKGATDAKHNKKIKNVNKAYNKSKKKMDSGKADSATMSNLSRMGVMQSLAGSLDMDKEIGTTDVHSTERIAPTDARFDPDSGVRMQRVNQPAGVRPSTYGAQTAATVQARRNRRAAQRAALADSTRKQVMDSLANAINDIKAKNIKGMGAMSKSAIKEVRKLLEGTEGQRISAFITAAQAMLQKHKSPLFKGDSMIVDQLKAEFGIDTDQAILMLEAVTQRQYSSSESAQEKERQETYHKVIMNTQVMYASASEFPKGTWERIAGTLSIPSYEVIDTYLGDSRAILHKRIKDLIDIKAKALSREIPRMERMEQEAIARGDMAAASIISDNLQAKIEQRDNMLAYKDEVDAYNALDKVNSITAATKAEMREWFYMGDNSFIERVKQDFEVGEFNDILKAMHADERMDRQIEMVKEALGLAKVNKLNIQEEIDTIKGRMGTKTERKNDEARLDTLKKKKKRIKEEIAELKQKRLKAVYHASDVVSPEGKAIMDKFKAMPQEKQDKFEALRQEMIENLLTKRLDMLLDAEVITQAQYDQLRAGGRKSVDEVNREQVTAQLREKLLAGKMTQAQYESAVDRLDDQSFYRKKQQELTKMRRDLEIQLDEALAEEVELDNDLIDGKISQFDYDKKIKEIQSRIDKHEQAITDIEAAKKDMVYKYKNFSKYVPFSINEDAYIENFIAKMYEENIPAANRMDYIEATRGLSALMQEFGNDVLADSSSPEFGTLSDAVRDSMNDGITDKRKLKERARRFDKIKKLTKKGKRRSGAAQTNTTIEGIKGNYDFSLNDMNPPMAVLMNQFETAAKVATRNEAKLKLVKLINEVNDIISQTTDKSDLVHFNPIGRVILSEGNQSMKLSKEVKMIWEDQQPTTKIGELTTEERETAMSVLIGGRPHTIVFGVDPDTKLMARALIQDEATDFEQVFNGRMAKAWKGFANMYRAMITTASIYFNINNVQRDALEAMANIHYVQDTFRQDGVESTGEMAKRMAKDTARMMKNITKMIAAYNSGASQRVTIEVPDPNGGTYKMTLEEIIAEAKAHGGLMSWSMLNDNLEKDGLEAAQDYISKKAEEAGRYKDKSKAYKVFTEGARVLFSLPKVWKMGNPEEHRAMYYMNKIADSLENHNRLAAYMMAREKGLSASQAAGVSRNATVNFEKAGTLLKSAKLPNQTQAESTAKSTLQFVQGMYLFIRPAIQGARKNIQRIGTKEGRMGMAAMMIMSMAKNAMYIMIHNDEDETELKNLYRDLYVNEAYYQIPVGKGSNINIAKPYSVDRVIDNTVNRIYGAKYTGDTAASIFWKGLKDFLRISTPIDITQKNRGIAMFAPTAAQPFADLWTNTTYSGRQPLRNTDDLSESISLDMLKGTHFFGKKASDYSAWVWMSDKFFDMGVENRLTSPQGLEHLWNGYVANAGYFKFFKQASRSLSETTREKLQRDEDLTLDRIRLIQTGKTLRYITFDEGKNKMASTLYTQAKEPIGRNIKTKAAAIKAIEDGFLANEELGNIESSGQRTNMKRTLNNWFVANSRDGDLTIALMEEFAPEVTKFLGKNKLKDKQLQSVTRGQAGFSEKDQKRLERAGAEEEINLDMFEGKAEETIEESEDRSIRNIEKYNEKGWGESFWDRWFK